jgi:hypothetical protein
MTDPAVALGYLEHLGPADLRLLARVAGDTPEALRSRPDRLVALLGVPATEAAVLRPAPDEDPFLRASPFLAFAVAVHRSAATLERATSTLEWVGPRQRLPVFDVAPLRAFLADPLRRLFLVELLASFTSVSSGSTWERTRRGWRRRRFSELDPVRLASLLEVVPEAERPGVYRRLGDLALFLTGVFPDHTAERALGPLDAGRLVHLLAAGEGTAAGPPPEDAHLGTVGLLEHLGARWYRCAAAATPASPTATARVLPAAGDRFRQARRILNLVSESAIFPLPASAFGLPGP